MSVRAYPPAEAVIFDMDGLLVDSEPYWRDVELAVFARHGIDIAPLVGRGLTKGMRVDEVVAFFRSRIGFRTPSDPELVEEIVDGVAAAIRAGGELLPGALDALELVERLGLHSALASGSTWPVIDAVIDRTGLDGRFAVISSAADDRLGKPHPAILLRTAAALELDPISCLVLEDSLNGCVAAKAARMRVIAVPRGSDREDPRFALADLVLDSLTDLRRPEVTELIGHLVHP